MSYRRIDLDYINEDYRNVLLEALNQMIKKNNDNGYIDLNMPYKDSVKQLNTNIGFATIAGHLECVKKSLECYQTNDVAKKMISKCIMVLIKVSEFKCFLEDSNIEQYEKDRLILLFDEHMNTNFDPLPF